MTTREKLNKICEKIRASGYLQNDLELSLVESSDQYLKLSQKDDPSKFLYIRVDADNANLINLKYTVSAYRHRLK